MTEKDTPLALVHAWQKRMKGCYEILDNLAATKSWPDYCVLPMNAVAVGMKSLKNPFAIVSATSELTACWLWRKNKIIYQFNKELTETLTSQPMDDILPTKLLLHTPYPIVYVKVRGIMKQADGFFYWIDYDIAAKKAGLQILWLEEDMIHTTPQTLHLLPGASIRDCLLDTFPGITESSYAFEYIKAPLVKAIQLMLYLVAQNADITDDQPYKKKSRKVITDVPSEVHTYSVGVRIGAAMRRGRIKHESGMTGSPKRPHSRRGHWHHYWTGSKQIPEERKLILKWLAPIYVNAGDAESVVVYPVK